MKTYLLTATMLFTTIVNLSNAQSYVGYTVDNYAGVHGISYNPSNVVGSRLRADINLFSLSIFGGSDYFGINLSDILSSDGGFEFEDDAERFPSDANNFFFNADILGPSFMFNLNKKSSIAVTSRVRAFFNINGINGELFESINESFDANNDFNFNSRDLKAIIHAWGEVGLTYGRILINQPHHVLKAGVTIKYLLGAGSAFIESPGLQGQFTASSSTLATQGAINYGFSQDFENDDITFENLTTGFGADVGVTYEWHPKRNSDSLRIHQSNYKLKVAASITDIGSISYNNAEITSYDLNNTVNTEGYDDSTEDFLDDNYLSTETTKKAKIELPTALHLLVDYRLAKKWLISAQANLSMVKDNAEQASSVINTLVVAPRLETKNFSLYVPVSFREYNDVSFGAGIRFNGIIIGSGSILTNLLSDSTKTTDVYIGFKWPLYRK